jgi:hypothetical protein
MSKTPKAEIFGWIDEPTNKPISNIPTKCPQCGHKLHRVDISWYNGEIWVFCYGNFLPDKDGYKVKPCLWCAKFKA